MRYDYTCSITLHINPAASSDDENLRSSFNDEPKFDYHIPKFSIYKSLYSVIICQQDSFKKISRMAIKNNFSVIKFSGNR